MGVQRFEYDTEHRLIALHQRPESKRLNPEQQSQAGSSTRFEYDALGRRIAKTHQETSEAGHQSRPRVTRFGWDGLRLLSEIREPLFEQQARHHSLYIYEDEGSYEPLARVYHTDGQTEAESARVLHFHNDLSGKPEALSSVDQRQVIWKASYKVWGNTLSEKWSGEYAQVDARTVAQNIRFQGQYLDPETGLHYNTFRFYDPDIGRFITPDPIGLAGGLNQYQYAPNPVSWADPWGWCKQSARLRTVGRTPGKGSKTGQAVIARMRAEGTIRGTGSRMQYKASDGKWYSIKTADMAHRTDAVRYWNQRGGFYGAKAPEVRAWMRDPNNYVLDHRSLNRSAGARLGEVYREPGGFIGPAEKPAY